MTPRLIKKFHGMILQELLITISIITRISSETFIIRTSIYQKNNPFIITSESIAQLKCKFPQNPESKVSENPIKICFCMKRDITGLAYFVAFILKEELNSPILMTTVQFRFRFRNYIGKVFTNFRSWNQNMIKKRNIIIIKCNRCYGWSIFPNKQINNCNDLF